MLWKTAKRQAGLEAWKHIKQRKWLFTNQICVWDCKRRLHMGICHVSVSNSNVHICNSHVNIGYIHENDCYSNACFQNTSLTNSTVLILILTGGQSYTSFYTILVRCMDNLSRELHLFFPPGPTMDQFNWGLFIVRQTAKQI